MNKIKLVRVSTVALSLDLFFNGFLKELNGLYEVEAISSPSHLLKKIEQREGVKTYSVEMERKISPWSDLKALVKMWWHFLRVRPDCVHSITPKGGLLAMMAACLARVPVRVHTFTGLLFPTAIGIKKIIFRMADKMICKCATHIVAEGEGVREDMQKGGIDSQNIEVLGNGSIKGVDTDYFNLSDEVVQSGEEIKKRLGIQKDEVSFVYVGRIVKDKGIEELLTAFNQTKKVYERCRLIMVGFLENKEGDQFERNILEKTLEEENISVVKWVEDVRPYYALADCVVLPSYREGFPNVVLEAQSMERMCIVTNVNGSREIIKNGKNGFIVNSKDSSQMSQAMIHVCHNESLRKEMGIYGRHRVKKLYEMSMVRRIQRDYYAKLLDNN